MHIIFFFFFFFFFNDTATTEIYTLSLHDALPNCGQSSCSVMQLTTLNGPSSARTTWPTVIAPRSEEHTSDLQSLAYLVCRLLLEKKNNFYLSVPILINNYITIVYP